jgi:pyruvate formate lyase activating enzyme
MKVNLGGLVHLSTIDWLGQASMVVFLRGCPLRCPHCQNKELQGGEEFMEISRIKEELKRASSFISTSAQTTLEDAFQKVVEKPFISAIVFSGGEPLMQTDQVAVIAGAAKKLGLITGLETCGYFPDSLEWLLEKGLLDKIFLDIKAALHDPEYEKATGRICVAPRVKESLRASMEFGVPLEVRTTIFPDMPSPSEVFEIAKTLSVLKRKHKSNKLDFLVLQQGRPGDANIKPVSMESLKLLSESAKDLMEVHIRGTPKLIKASGNKSLLGR